MSSRPAFNVVDAPPSCAENGTARTGLAVLHAVARRLDFRLLLWMLVFLIINRLWHMAEDGGAFEDPPPHFAWAIAVIEIFGTVCITLAVLVADEWVDRGAWRGTTYGLAVALGAAAGAGLQWVVRGAWGLQVYLDREPWEVRISQPAQVWCWTSLVGWLITFIYVHRRTAERARIRTHRAELARAIAQRATLESQLQAMQARVEPQFLFNTLAQVRALYDQQPEAAGTMLDDLIAYLRAALPHLRLSRSTIAKEVELVRAYLAIMRVRLGERLDFEFQVPPEVADASIPPMILLPLVDHALVYGFAPSHGHGQLRIETEAGGGRLRLAVSDSGAGFVAGNAADGLRNLDERLNALYGDQATLKFEALCELGTRAVLEIPYESDDGADR